MRTDTQSVTLEADADSIFQFLADPENLPRWAVAFAHGVRREGDGWVVRTANGDVVVRVEADARLRTVDFHMAPAPGVEAVAYSRVLPNDHGAEYVFTQLQSPSMPDAVFDGQVRALAEELRVLQSLVRARMACPI